MPDLSTKDALLERMVSATENLKNNIPVKFDDYLPLTGGTMTGPITRQGTATVVYTLDNGSVLNFNAYNSENSGAQLSLFGKDHTGAGRFSLYAMDGVNVSELRGLAGGDLKWGANRLNGQCYGVTISQAEGYNTHTFTLSENSAVIFAKRYGSCSCHMVTIWDADSTVIFSTGVDPITITKEAGSSSVTITNALTSSIAVKILNGGSL